MTDAFMVAIAIAVAAPVYAGATFVLARGARAWSDAVTAQHGARHAAVQATVSEEVQAALDPAERPRANPRAAYAPPTEEEIRERLIAERDMESFHRENAAEWTTTGNEGYEEVPPIPSGGLYAEK